MTDILREVAAKKTAGEAFVLATIIRTIGSSPRQPGARMIICPDQSIIGTIGGGHFEKLVIDDSVAMFRGDDQTLFKSYRFEEQGEDATGMSCGGEAHVFLEVFHTPRRLVVFGGGHVCRALVQLIQPMDFCITVVDDRAEILDYFPDSITTMHTDNQWQENFPPLDRNTYVVIVTKGHKGDKSVLARVLQQQCAYVGMIGSKAKIKHVFDDLEAEGVDPALFKQVYSPIGLDIGGEGPHEIAVSILAEIIAVQRGKIAQFR